MILTGILAIGTGATCLLAQAPPAGQKGPAPKSKGEVEALQALQAAGGDPDKSIAAAENLITKFADTDFKAIALYIEADAYERKGDFNRMEIFAERVLEADPKDFRATLMLAKHYAMHTGQNDLDREEKLGKAEKYANQVIEMMKTAPKPNTAITEEQWTEVKKDSAAEGYNAIGLANLTRKKYDAAAAAFKGAVEANSRPEPAYMVRLASALQSAGKNDEAIVWCDKVTAIPDAHPQIKSVATQIRAGAIKAGGKAPGGEAK
jgi:tetratricopeptide (TPR) repeat protein